MSKVSREEEVHNNECLFCAASRLKHLGIMAAQQCGPVVSTTSATNRNAEDGGSGDVVIAITSDRQVTADLFQFFDHITRA